MSFHGGRTTFALLLIVLFTAGSRGVASAQSLPGFERGDCNSDGTVNIADCVYLAQQLFGGGGVLSCDDACDMNDDGTLDIADPIYGLNYIFTGGSPLAEPTGTCGFDATPDALGCDTGTCAFADALEERSFTLETGRVGLPYTGSLPADAQEEVYWQIGAGSENVITPEIPFVEYGLPLGETLPTGLELDPATGVISGTPEDPGFHQIDIWAERLDGGVILYHVDLAIFTSDESEIVPGQDLTVPGTHTVAVFNGSFTYTHHLPYPAPYPLWQCSASPGPPTVNQVKSVLVYYPNDVTDRMPVLFFHHGTGFTWNQYTTILNHLASYGIICVSVNDQYSYLNYTFYYCWGGHDEGARVLLATREYIAGLDEDPASVLYQSVDWNRVFYGGHSRGAASAIIASEMDPDTRGVVALQPTDAKGDSFIGYTNRWDVLPDVPILNMSAEQDYDVVFPWAERLLERFQGAATMVVVYGGCHGYTTDNSNNGCDICNWTPTAPYVDQCRYAPRSRQLETVDQFATAFLLRYGFGDLSTEGILYGEEYENSPYVGLAYRRNLSTTIVVDDFSSFPTNNLGFNLTWVGVPTGNLSVGACYDYPGSPPAPITPITNLVASLPQNGTLTFDSPLGTAAAPLNVVGHKRLTFRIKNRDRWNLVDNFGYSWLQIQVSLTDADGDVATVDLTGRLPSEPTYPDPEPSYVNVTMKYQRYITLSADLSEFQMANGNLDLGQLVDLGWQLDTNGTSTFAPVVAFDDVHFE